MRRKKVESFDAKDDEAFDKYLHVIGASIIELNEQMEEVD